MSQFQLALWIAHPVLQLIVAAVMYRRKLHRSFPVFFAYVVSQILIFSIVFPVYRYGSYPHFFYVYWVCAAISLALGFKVIHEIFLDIFRPYHTLKDLGSVLFKWSGLVMLLVAVVVAAASPSGDQDPLVQSVLTVQRCVSMSSSTGTSNTATLFMRPARHSQRSRASTRSSASRSSARTWLPRFSHKKTS
ncbi:MAG: hypothetical protein LAO03_12525 [Acidobacteriia bacterium]|nr:hypothetical protein [Terriglobia bacterium]